MNSKGKASDRFAADVRQLPRVLRFGPHAKEARAAVAAQKAVDQAEQVLINAQRAAVRATDRVKDAEAALGDARAKAEAAQQALSAAEASSAEK